MNRINDFFLSDQLEPARVPLARLTVTILLFSLLAAAGIVVVTLINGDVESNRAFLILIVGIVASLWLFRGGQNTAGASVFTILLWGVISYIVFTVGDGTKAVQILGYPVLILIATLILGRNGAILATVLSSISFVGISLAQKYEWLGPYELADRIDLYDGVVAVITFLLVAVIQRALYANLTDSLDEVRKQETVLESALDELQQTQASLEATIERRTAQIYTSAEVGRVASALMDPDEIIQQTVQLISERFGYYYAAIFLVDENRIWAELKAATGEGGQALLERRHRLQVGGNSMVGASVATGSARIALDVGQEPVRFDNPLLPETRSEIALPLIAGGQIIGALDVQSVIEAAFSEEDIETLQNMANQVAVAIENARLYQEAQTRLRELNRLYRQQEVTSMHSIQLVNNQIITNMPVAVPDLHKVLAEKRIAVRHEENRTVATIPMLSGGQVIGVLNMKSKNRPWTDEEISIVESISAQAAVALENARLVRESQLRAERERVFNESTARIRETLDIETILQTAAEEMRQALGLSQVEIQIGQTVQAASESGSGNGESKEPGQAS